MTPTGKGQVQPPQVAGGVGFWKQITPGAGAIDPNAQGIPCDAVYVDTDMAQVTGKRGVIGTTDAATISPPLAAGVPHALSFWSITAVSAGNVWALWYINPN